MNKNSNKWNLQNTYSKLPNCFYKEVKPTLVKNPKMVCFNKNLAKKLNLDFLKFYIYFELGQYNEYFL